MKSFLFLLLLLIPFSLSAQNPAPQGLAVWKPALREITSLQNTPFMQNIFDCDTDTGGKALQILKKNSREIPGLKPYVLFREALCLNKAGSPAAALALLEEIRDGPRKIDGLIFWEKIEALLALKKWQQTSKALDRRRKKNVGNEKGKISFYRGKLFFLQNQHDPAARTWKNIFLSDAGSPFEDKILSLLGKKDVFDLLTEVELKQRATRLMANGLPLEAVAIYKRLAERLAGAGKNLTEELAGAYFAAKKYEDASRYFHILWDNPRPGQNRFKLLSRLVTSYSRSDQFEKALEYRKKLVALNPKLALGGDERTAFFTFDAGQYDRARVLYTQLLFGKQGNTKFLWKRFWCSYLLGDFKGALDDSEELLRRDRNKDKKRIYTYWKARLLQKQGEKTEAGWLFKSLIKEKEIDYYAGLAEQRLTRGTLEPQILASPSLFKEITPSPPKIREADEKIQPMDSLATAIHLARAGLDEFAYDEAKQSPLLRSGLPLSRLASLLEEAHFFSRLAHLGTSLLETRSPAADQAAWQWAYPQAYKNWVRPYAVQNGVDPLLAWALMKQESSFRPTVVSRAYAIGLMQILPQTGKEISDEDGEFHPADLETPAVNIRYGMGYFKKCLDKFSGNLSYAIAAYNAGPDAVNRWRKWGDKLEADEFIELIPYVETGDYVKKALTNYWVYKRLYE